MKRLLTLIPRHWLLALYELSMDECFRREMISWIKEPDDVLADEVKHENP